MFTALCVYKIIVHCEGFHAWNQLQHDLTGLFVASVTQTNWRIRAKEGDSRKWPLSASLGKEKFAQNNNCWFLIIESVLQATEYVRTIRAGKVVGNHFSYSRFQWFSTLCVEYFWSCDRVQRKIGWKIEVFTDKVKYSITYDIKILMASYNPDTRTLKICFHFHGLLMAKYRAYIYTRIWIQIYSTEK